MAKLRNIIKIFFAYTYHEVDVGYYYLNND